MRNFLLMVIVVVFCVNAQYSIQDIASPSRTMQMDDSMFCATDSIDTAKLNGTERECNGVYLSAKSDTGLVIEINYLSNPAGQWSLLRLEPGIWTGAFFRIWRWRNTTATPDSLEFSLKVYK